MWGVHRPVGCGATSSRSSSRSHSASTARSAETVNSTTSRSSAARSFFLSLDTGVTLLHVHRLAGRGHGVCPTSHPLLAGGGTGVVVFPAGVVALVPVPPPPPVTRILNIT